MHHQLWREPWAPSTRARAHLSALPHAGDRLNGVPSTTLEWVFTFRIRSRSFAPDTLLHGLECLYTAPALNATIQLILWRTPGAMEAGSPGTMPLRCHLYSAAQSAALAPVKEMPNLISDSLFRSADVILPTWSHGRPPALDVHVISPLQQQTLGEAASTWSCPASWYSAQVVLLPLDVQISLTMSEIYSGCDGSPGGLTKNSILILCSLGKSIGHSRVGCLDASVCTKLLFHRTAITLACGGKMPQSTLWLHHKQLFLPQWTV